MPTTRTFGLTFFYLVTLGDLDLKYVYRKPRMALIGVRDTIHVHLLLLPFDAIIVRDKTKYDKLSNNFIFDPNCNVIADAKVDIWVSIDLTTLGFHR